MTRNVLIFCHSPATQFIDICNQYHKLFDPQKFTVTVAYLTGKFDPDIRERTLASQVIFFNFAPHIVRGLKILAIRKLWQLCRAKKFEIVICHRYKPSYIMMWVAQFIRIPALFFVMHELGSLQHIPRKLLISGLSKRNMFFVGVSDAVRDDIQKTLWRVPHERIITLYNMIDIDLTEPAFLPRQAAREALGLPHDAFVFGNIGRLAINKDQKTLIEAFAQVKSQYPQAKLIILGNGQLESDLKKQLITLQLTHDVLLTGFLPNAFRYVKAFDAYISSSIQEAFGRVLLEAMLARVPVIATAVNGVPEVIGNAGKLIPAANVTLLANEMSYISTLSDTLRQQWGQKGYDRVKQYFSLQKFNEIFWALPIIKDLST